MAKKCVLIVEEEANLRLAIRTILERSGYEVAEASDGPEALINAKALCPDVILLDVLGQKCDGYEVCRRLKMHPKTKPIPVIFMTGAKDAAQHRRAEEAGAVACLTKPFYPEALVAFIEAALANAGRPAEPTAKDGSGRS